MALDKENHIRFVSMVQYSVAAVKMIKGNEENPRFVGFTSHHDNDHYRTSRSPNRAPTFFAIQKRGHTGYNPLADDRFWSERCVASQKFTKRIDKALSQIEDLPAIIKP